MTAPTGGGVEAGGVAALSDAFAAFQLESETDRALTKKIFHLIQEQSPSGRDEDAVAEAAFFAAVVRGLSNTNSLVRTTYEETDSGAISIDRRPDHPTGAADPSSSSSSSAPANDTDNDKPIPMEGVEQTGHESSDVQVEPSSSALEDEGNKAPIDPGSPVGGKKEEVHHHVQPSTSNTTSNSLPPLYGIASNLLEYLSARQADYRGDEKDKGDGTQQSGADGGDDKDDMKDKKQPEAAVVTAVGIISKCLDRIKAPSGSNILVITLYDALLTLKGCTGRDQVNDSSSVPAEMIPNKSSTEPNEKPVASGESETSNAAKAVRHEEFRNVLITMFEAMESNVQKTVESWADFDYLWMSLQDNAPGFTSLFQSDEVDSSADTSEAPKTSDAKDPAFGTAKEFSWLLSRVVCLHRRLDFTSLDEDEHRAKQQDEEGRGPSKIPFGDCTTRRQNILIMAACIALVSEASLSSSRHARKSSNTNKVAAEPESKSGQEGDGGPEPKKKSSGSTEGYVPTEQPSRLNIEDEAIAALSMMVSGTENTPGGPKPSVTKDHKDVNGVLMTSINYLLKAFHISPSVSPSDIESAVAQATEHVWNRYCSPSPGGKRSLSLLLPAQNGENEQEASKNKKSSVDQTVSTDQNGAAVEGKAGESADAGDEQKSGKGDGTISSFAARLAPYLSIQNIRTANLAALKNVHREVVVSAWDFVERRSGSSGRSSSSMTGTCASEQDVKDKDKDDKTNELKSGVDSSARSSVSLKQNLLKSLPYVDGLNFLSESKCQWMKLLIDIKTDSPDGTDRTPTSTSKGSRTQLAQVLEYTRWPAGSVIAQSDPQAQSKPSSVGTLTASASTETQSTMPTSGVSILESMELNEWTEVVLSLSSPTQNIKPSTRLLLYMDSSVRRPLQKKQSRPSDVSVPAEGWRTVIPAVLNRALSRICENSSSPSDDDHPSSLRPQVSAVTGEFRNGNMANSPASDLPAALVILYYRVLESILYNETARLRNASHPKLVLTPAFHKSLIAVSYICLLKAMDNGGGPTDVYSVLQLMEITPYEYLKVSETFVRALKLNRINTYTANAKKRKQNQQAIDLPIILRRHLRETEEIVMDSLLWVTVGSGRLFEHGHNLPDKIKVMIPFKGDWPPNILRPALPEELEDEKNSSLGAVSPFGLSKYQPRHPERAYVSFIVRKLLTVTSHRISTICANLPTTPPHHRHSVSRHVWIAFRYLLRNCIYLIYDRHIDQLILCTIYSVCKVLDVQPELTFKKIIEIYGSLNQERLGKRSCHRIIHHIRLYPDDVCNQDPQKQRFGNIISFYNHIYVQAMKPHLRFSKSLESAKARLKGGNYDENASQSTGGAPTVAGPVASNVPRYTKPAEAKKLGIDPSSIRVPQSNVFLTVTTQSSSTTGQKKRTALNAMSPKTRALYVFGGSKEKDMALVNRTIGRSSKRMKTAPSSVASVGSK